MRSILLLLFCIAGTSAYSQSLCRINGADVYTGTGLEVYVGGTLINDSTSLFENQGNIHVVGDFLNNGQCNHLGQFSLSGNWINNSAFIAQPNSDVFLDGVDQSIKGISQSSFGRLQLNGTGEKSLEQNTQTESLFLFDRLLLTDSFRMKVNSTQTSAIQRTSGYVISERYGKLERSTISGQTYLYPVGRGANYQPVEITPASNSSNLGVRLADADASLEDLPRTQVDTSICRSNADYYHLISGNIPLGSQVRFEVDSITASEFPSLANREINQNIGWNYIVSQSPNYNGTTAKIEFNTQSSGADQAYLLVRTRPLRPIIAGDTAFCQLSENAQFYISSSQGLQTNWQWVSGELVEQSDSILTVNWGNQQTGLISAVQTDNAGCSSFSSEFIVTLWPLPVASFVTEAPEIPFEDQPFSLINTSLGSIGQIWNITDESELTDSLITVRFDNPGIYNVLLTVNNEFGCIDTASGMIEVIEGMEFPNTFSPNDDGVNDELVLMNSGIKEFSLQVYDRWGNSVFESNASKLSWDGRTSSGVLVNPGTYFLVLNAASLLKNYEKRFTVSVFY
jgi:gliding motility-associated-like protein